jgi:hypothetical protein
MVGTVFVAGPWGDVPNVLNERSRERVKGNASSRANAYNAVLLLVIGRMCFVRQRAFQRLVVLHAPSHVYHVVQHSDNPARGNEVRRGMNGEREWCNV